MKRIIIIISLYIISLTSTYSQTNQDYINNLYNDTLLVRVLSLFVIIDDNISEALPVLEELYDTQPPKIQLSYLQAMMQFNEPNIHQRLIDYIQRADTFGTAFFGLDPLKARVQATHYLFTLGDYSTYHYIFEAVERQYDFAYDGLRSIMENVPSARDSARNMLLDYWDNGKNARVRFDAMWHLVKADSSEHLDRIVNTFISDSMPNKILAFDYLVQLNYPQLEPLLRTSLANENYWSLRVDIADTLLIKYGNPFNVKLVKDYQPTEPDTTAKSLMNFSLLEFIPPQPDSTISALVMTDTLISYNNQLYSFQWITSDSLHSNYATRLQTIRDFIANSNYTNAQTEIDTMQASVEENYNSPIALLTSEGWKFLHYYLKYIEELNKLCGLN